MKKIFYLFLILSLAFGLQSCGGSGGSADDPEPGPEPGATKVSFALNQNLPLNVGGLVCNSHSKAGTLLFV